MTTAAGSARPLRVSFVADTEGWGGAEVWLVHHLRRAADHDLDVSLVCAEEVADRLRPEVPDGRLAVVPLARHQEKALATQAALEEQAPDVVLVNLVDPASNAATLDAALAVAPTVGVLHLVGDLGPEPAALAARYADLAALLTPSEEGVELVRSRLAVPRGGTVITCNGVDVPPDPQGPAGHRPPRLGAFGRLTRQKGYDVLLEAVGILVERGVAFEVLLGGSGREEAALRSAARGLPVTFAGWVHDPRVFLADVDVFCLSSRSDALPLALLEAMAEGLPCVSTDVGDVASRLAGAVEVVPVEDAEALADALQVLLEDGDRAAALGWAARERVVAGHDAAGMVAGTVAVLRRAAGGSWSLPGPVGARPTWEHGGVRRPAGAPACPPSRTSTPSSGSATTSSPSGTPPPSTAGWPS